MEPWLGNALVLGDNINSELIHPAQFFSLDPQRVREGLFQGISPTLGARVTERTLIVSGRNFGCGSSREVSVQALCLHGVRLLVAASFARIFYRNCINNGIFPIVCPDAYKVIGDGSPVHVDIAAGRLDDLSTGCSWTIQSPDTFVMQLLGWGGA